MLVELGCIVAGVPLGYALRHKKGVVHAIDVVLTWTVRVMLFLLGLALGADVNLMAQLETLGLRGAVVSLGAVVGSLVVARLLAFVLPLGPRPAGTGKGDANKNSQAVQA